jgi:hypothetical protein
VPSGPRSLLDSLILKGPAGGLGTGADAGLDVEGVGKLNWRVDNPTMSNPSSSRLTRVCGLVAGTRGGVPQGSRKPARIVNF